MRVAIVVIVVLAVACGGANQEAPHERTLPEPLHLNKLPDPIPDVPAGKRVVEAVSSCAVEVDEGAEPRQVGPGVFMSYEMSQRASKTKVGYDELRGLYEVDLRTFERERQVYQKHLDLADDEIGYWREKARRSWWERNKGLIGLAVGVVVGAGLTVGILAATEEVRQ